MTEGIPTYSLLKQHETIVSYAIPDPLERTHSFLILDLFSWNLHDENGTNVTEFKPNEPTKSGKEYDGIGFQIHRHPPAGVNDNPQGLMERVERYFDTFNRGKRKGSPHFRVQETSPEEIRQFAQTEAHRSFCYWWLLDTHHPTYEPTLIRDETTHERKARLDTIERVEPDGTLHIKDESPITEPSLTAPYSLDSCELINRNDWETPKERSLTQFNRLAERLRDEYGYDVVRNAIDDLDIERKERNQPQKTPALKKKETLRSALIEADPTGVGYRIRERILKHYDSLDQLTDALSEDPTTLSSLIRVSEQKSRQVLKALQEENYLGSTN